MRTNARQQAAQRSALRKAPKISYARLQHFRQETVEQDSKRVTSGRAAPDEILLESRLFTDDEIKTFKLGNLEQVLAKTP
jgi:hypothetical protein